ncbi:GNAT family N-acetyltransferase [Ferrimonas balearica]|nr:GNAT family N-acetyltransferase [Ferrimonas balearica]
MFSEVSMKEGIRPATRSDADAVLRLRQRAILHGCAGHYPAADLALWSQGAASEAFLSDLEQHFYLLEQDGVLAGSGMVNLEDGRIDAIFTDPDWVGQGVGSTLMVHLEALARAHGLAELTLDATLNAAPFYRRCGFVGEAQSQYHSPRGLILDCVPMRKLLT